MNLMDFVVVIEVTEVTDTGTRISDMYIFFPQ